MVSQTLRKTGPIDAPPGSERLTARQIAIAKQRRREGASIGAISEQMGISKETVFRHTKGITPAPRSVEPTVKEPTASPVVPQNNGGEAPKIETPKPSIIQIGVELDPELMLMLAGTASVQGFTSLKTYLKDYALPWLNTMKEAQDLVGSQTPADHLAKLEVLMRGYVAYQEMLRRAQERVERNVEPSVGPKVQPS